jgi:hypothetical protein
MGLKVSEEEFANLQAALSSKFNKDEKPFRYLFHEPRITGERTAEIRYEIVTR